MNNILLVGCGKMGGAMLRGWIERGVARETITVIEPNEAAATAIRTDLGVSVISNPAEADAAAIVVFAVKPQGLPDIAPQYRRFADPDTVFLSIAAGRTIAFFRRHLGAEAAIVRTMPNTPAAVGRGITAAFANPRVSAAQRGACANLLEAVGEVVWVGDEGLLDAVTALSGSGPAYVFLLIECMARAGVECGLPEDTAMRLARATVIGSGELARQSAEPADVLRKNVTSPGGTTEAALKVMMAEDGMQRVVSAGIAAANARSKELAG